MAISATHWSILQELKRRDILPQGCRILEIGEANYYGDFDPVEVVHAVKESFDTGCIWTVARRIYEAMFDPVERVAIDAGGFSAHKLDLNSPVEGFTGFHVTYNHGTAEHVFNIAQVFRTMHDATVAGGLMIHESPFTGWLDHGFYCLQPTLFWDLAAANNYAIEFAAVEHLASRTWREVGSREELLEAKRRGELADNLMLFVVLRKTTDQPFVVPQQGIYSAGASKEVQRAWRQLR